MELRAYGSSLRAFKSWFCLDDVIACVGSGIGADAGTAETVVENRKLTDPGAALLVDGSPAPTGPGWSAPLDAVRRLHLEGTSGYVFPRQARCAGRTGGTHRDLAGDQPQVRHRHPGHPPVPDAGTTTAKPALRPSMCSMGRSAAGRGSR
ncbi:polysaccharide lyase family 8 super-sandwich domain-containing protein [Streptomyces sp. NPDC050509]|uniref:polysaccharide lyase family 8 super-sandwich domain-containing protein n=1 Tax=Streptomyces sp. NPDC050509 TaxID=3365620 RepID=UPI003787FD8A